MTLVVLGAIVAMAQSLQPPASRLHGRITDASSEEPVPAAVVYVTGESVARFALTNETGRYVFTNLPAGRFRFSVVHPGFEPMALEIELRAGPGMQVDVPLRVKPVPSTPLRIVAERASLGARDDGGDEVNARLSKWTAGLRWLGAGPNSASALSDMVAAQAAAQPDPDGRDAPHVLYLWGTNTEQGRVLLDGAALGAPLHLGGLLAPLDPELLASAQHHSGGASPRLDGGTMHVMEFRTRPVADRARVWGEVDALAARIGVEAPFGPAGILVSGRRVNSEVIEWITDRPLGYDYGDALVRADLRPSVRDRVQATAFATDEAITIPRDFTEDHASWRNLAVSAAWTRTGAAEASIGMSYGHAAADLPYLRAPNAHVVSAVDHAAIRAARRTLGTRTSTVIGLDVERTHFGRRTRGVDDTTQLVASGCGADATCLDADITIVAGYGEVAWQPRPGWRLGGGARLSWNDAHGSLEVLPRASVTAILGDATTASLSAGRYSRATVLDLAPRADAVIPLNDVDGSQSLTPERVVATASHLQLAVTRRTGRSVAGASAILRHHDAVAGRAGRTVPGIEAWWLLASGPLDASVGYSWMGGAADARSDSTTQRNRHVLSASLARSTGPLRFNISAAWATGLPFVALALDDPDTAPVLTGSESLVEPGPQPAGRYLRVDATATATWRVNWLDRETSVTPYLKLINALGRRDALFYFQEAGADGRLRALAAVPLVPTLGLRWSF